MTPKLLNFRRRYQAALRKYLEPGGKVVVDSAEGLGNQALVAGLGTLDLAKFHEQTLVLKFLPACPVNKRASLLRRAGAFFAAAITPGQPPARLLQYQGDASSEPGITQGKFSFKKA